MTAGGGMKFRPAQFLSLRLILIALSLFSLAQVIAEGLAPRYGSDSFAISGGATLMHGDSGFNYEPALLSSFILIASCLLLARGLLPTITAAALGGLAFYVTLPRSFWHMSELAGVQPFSRAHFGLWWQNLGAGQLLQIVLAAAVISFSAASLAAALYRRRRSQSVYP